MSDFQNQQALMQLLIQRQQAMAFSSYLQNLQGYLAPIQKLPSQQSFTFPPGNWSNGTPYQAQQPLASHHMNSGLVKKEEPSQNLAMNKDPPNDHFVELTTKNVKEVPTLTLVSQKPKSPDIEGLISSIIQYSQLNESQLQLEKETFLKQHPQLVKVYEDILIKFQEQRKSREEIIKYIMRKAFKFLFKSVQDNYDSNTSLKAASKICLQHYFHGINFEQDLEVLPFRKNCKIKTMNSSFLEKVFSSEKFLNDYQVFLGQFDEIINKDNQSKIAKVSQNIVKLLKQGQMNKIRYLRRMPCTASQMKEIKTFAEDLLTNYTPESHRKIRKLCN